MLYIIRFCNTAVFQMGSSVLPMVLSTVASSLNVRKHAVATCTFYVKHTQNVQILLTVLQRY